MSFPYRIPFDIFDILAVILCNFEDDFCKWQLTPSNPTLKWKRTTAMQLEEQQKPGPISDYLNHKDTFFVYAGLPSGNGVDNSVAKMKSPEFDAREHPLECFNFWFAFGSEGSGESLKISVDHDDLEPDIIWSLDQTNFNAKEWTQGRVEVTPREATETNTYRVSSTFYWLQSLL